MGFKPHKANPRAKTEHTYKLMPGEETVNDNQVSKCHYCGRRVAWLISFKGKKYPVNVSGERSHSYNLIVRRNDFHDCRGRYD